MRLGSTALRHMPYPLGHSRPTIRLLAWLVVVALAIQIVHSTFGFGAPRFSYAIEELLYDFITVTAALVVLGRAWAREEQRLAWALLGTGLFLWAMGDVYYTAVLRDQANPPFPSLDDALYLGGYIGVLAGLVAYLRSRVGRVSALVGADMAMGALCVAAIGSSLLLDYVLANTTGTSSQIAVAVSYPAFDLVLLAVAVSAITLSGWRPGWSLGLIAIGIGCAAIGDSFYTYQSLAGTYDGGDWNNALWPLANVLIAAAALQPAEAARPAGEGADDWRTFASPVVFALAVLTLLALGRQDLNEPVVAAFAIAALAVLAARVALTFVHNHRLVQRLKVDPLTGLLNRGKLIYDLDQLLAVESPEPHVLAIFDLDGFKAYNDAFGHPAGDAMLVRLGHQLATAVAEHGRAYRMGGDEFAIVVPGNRETATDAIGAGAAALAERGEGFNVSCSWGAVQMPSEAPHRVAALQLADQRMYAHKDSRRASAGGEVEAVLIRIINQRTPELAEHVDAVKSLCLGVGRALGMSYGELAALSRASELHDIGKIAIPDEILSKRGPLDEDEWRLMRQHTVMGERIVSAASSLSAVGSLIRSSHERWDGKGYPDGLTGPEIPLPSRIIAVCDAYDAIVSERPYAEARSKDPALAEVRRGAGTQFDPRVVDGLERVVSESPAGLPAVPQPVP
jgi:two-component system cell cycle response regulator